MTAEDFRTALDELLKQATQKGLLHIDIKSGDLHRKLGGYPSSSHRMPICCSVMKAAMRDKDEIMNAPSSGQGASLVIRYELPRR